MEATADGDDVLLRMTHAEALVLFEWVHRKEGEDVRLDHLGLVDATECMVLWGISGALEALLAEPFRQDYGDLLEAARSRVAQILPLEVPGVLRRPSDGRGALEAGNLRA